MKSFYRIAISAYHSTSKERSYSADSNFSKILANIIYSSNFILISPEFFLSYEVSSFSVYQKQPLPFEGRDKAAYILPSPNPTFICGKLLSLLLLIKLSIDHGE